MEREREHEIRYEMEELLPLVAKLAAKYTSGESSSIPYETAGGLMEAVCCCIRESERAECAGAGGNGGEQIYGLAEKHRMTAAESYRVGYESVVEKTKRAQERYNEWSPGFQAYGNENYRDTVLKSLPEFFIRYDPRFAPQETVIDLDYPVLRAVSGDAGIETVGQYIDYIALEQRFLQKFPEGMVEEVLARFHREYKHQFFNLCSIVLRHVLGAGLLGRQPGEGFSGEEYAALRQICDGKDREALTEILNRLTEKLVESGWGHDAELLRYLQGDSENFAAELAEGVRRNMLRNVIV